MQRNESEEIGKENVWIICHGIGQPITEIINKHMNVTTHDTFNCATISFPCEIYSFYETHTFCFFKKRLITEQQLIIMDPHFNNG